MKWLLPLLTAPAVLVLIQGRAEAVLNINIFESAGNVVVRTSGSLASLPQPLYSGSCGFSGAWVPGNSAICTGPNANFYAYLISGPSGIPGTTTFLGANSSIGPAVSFQSNSSLNLFRLFLDTSFTGGWILSESIYYNKNLAIDFGITTTGLIGTWALQPKDGTDPYNAQEQINLSVDPPPVPGPLPLCGAAAALGWSRRLRRRIGSASKARSAG
jgi:hypothetical protein